MLTFISLLKFVFPRHVVVFLILSIFTLSLNGCTPIYVERVELEKPTESKNLFVFFDGTANNPIVPTNIYRLYKGLEESKDNKVEAIYIEGVGNAKTPISSVLGQGVGFGMEERILRGYKFLVEKYQPGDRIFIFGFSRGAFTARSLAGLISYAGIPKKEHAELNTLWSWFGTSGFNIGNKILEFTKEQNDNNNKELWAKWERGDDPILKQKIKNEITSALGKPKNIEVQSAEVEFLGIWDTVPGSQGINYFDKSDLVCKQPSIIAEKKQRYQLDSYPPIHHIAHAVSKDEKRTQFKPLFLCRKEIEHQSSVHNKDLTTLDEMIFPGAHADVGGGYEHLNNQLPEISLSWMVEHLSQHYHLLPSKDEFLKKLKLNSDPKGLANLSISDKGGSTFSYCKDREFPSHIKPHESVAAREQAGLVPWLYFDEKPKSISSGNSCIKWVDPLKGEDIDKNKILCLNEKQLECPSIQIKFDD